MTSVEVRRPDSDALPRLLQVTATAFGETLTDAQEQRWLAPLEADRAWVAVDDSDIVGSAAAFTMELSVPGGATVPVGGLSYVGVLPSHRRRGVLRALMEAHLAEVSERSGAASVLTASETTIYRRFGYGVATHRAEITIETDRSAFITEPGAAGGVIELVDRTTARPAVAAVHDHVRAHRPGEVSRSENVWDGLFADLDDQIDDPDRGWLHALYRRGNRVDGYAIYRIREWSWPSGIARSVLEVGQLAAADPAAEAALWRFVLDTDLVETVLYRVADPEGTLRWRLAEPRRLRTTALVDHLWLAPTDPSALLGARTYPADRRGRVVLEVRWPHRDADHLALEVADGDGHVADADEDPDVSLSAGALGSLYLGTVTLETLAATGRATVSPGVDLPAVSRLLATDHAPFCATPF